MVVKRVDNIVSTDTESNLDVIIIELNVVGEEIEPVDGTGECFVIEMTADIRLCAVKPEALPIIVPWAALSVGGETNLWGCWSLFCKNIIAIIDDAISKSALVRFVKISSVIFSGTITLLDC